MYIINFKEKTMDYSTYFISLLITIFCYLGFPVIYVCWHGRVDSKEASRWALINSIVWTIVFIIVSASMNENALSANFSRVIAPAFLYYFIAKSIMTKKEK